jgi:F0F1-type ATP synthase membrane subunit c/vacuolar-type H+-ATPase subunit K
MEAGSMDELKMGYRTTAIVGVAMLSALFFYAVVVEILLRTGSYSTTSADSQDVIRVLRYAFLGTSIAMPFLAGVVRNITLSKQVATSSPQYKSPLSEPMARLRTASMITYAFSEVPALLGFILFILGGSRLDFYVLLAIALLSSYIYFPRYSQWEEWLKRQSIGSMSAGEIR